MLMHWDAAASLLEAVFRRAGFTSQEIQACIGEILDAEWRGKASFGLMLVPELLKLRAKKKGEPHVVRESSTSAFIEGNDGLAPAVATFAVELALNKVRDSGVALVGVRNKWPWLTAGYHVRRAAEQGYIAATWSAGVSIVAPHGAIRRVFGTNPFAIAVPAAGGPIVFDSAITAGAASALRDAKRAGQPLPPGIAIDSGGLPTRDPDAGREGALLPFGGHRGSGIGIVIELLGGAWIGAKSGTRRGTQRGFVYFVADRNLFGFGADFPSWAEMLVEDITAAAERPESAHIPGRTALDVSQPRMVDPEILEVLENLR
jgi:LDH2 family malate/lactate/ureidoglycolate dehydrogenase